MRLSEKKIEYLAKKITEELRNNSQMVQFLVSDKNIESVIYSIILKDMQREEQLEEEARKLLQSHSKLIEQEGADYKKLLEKTKILLAKKKGIVL